MVKLRTVQKLVVKKAEEFRKKGIKKALLILPTGLGKTLPSLCDALNYIKKYEKRTGKKGKILMLAHNHNLLHQHAKDFKLLCTDRKIGFLYNSKKEINVDILFANIMTIGKKKYLNSFKKDEFVYIIIDETHHAGAKSYQCIFEYFKPEFLLGITATPNRTDKKDIFQLYDNNKLLDISREEAINKEWLRKMKYVFLYDKWCNYDDVKGCRTKEGFSKYDIKELAKKYNVPERDKAIIDWFKNNARDRKGIGFCVGIDESKRMAKLFVDNGIKAVAIYGLPMKEKIRDRIIKDYILGKYQLIFNCDLIGEGLHFPGVDVILKLRPTESHIKNTQQTGRGLINIEGHNMSQLKYKKLLIFDLVGNYKKSFHNYISLGFKKNHKNKKIRDIRDIIELPLGCEVEFDPRTIKTFIKGYNENNKYTIEEQIERFKKFYPNKKPNRKKLQTENGDIYYAFYRRNLLDIYCKKQLHHLRNLKEQIKRYKEIYGDKKVYRGNLALEHQDIYAMFKKHNQLDTYCYKTKHYTLSEQKKRYKNYYGTKKIGRNKLKKEHSDIHGQFQIHGLLDKYTAKPVNSNKKKIKSDVIKIFKSKYKHNKPLRNELHKNDGALYSYAYRNKLLNKFCCTRKEREKEITKKQYQQIKEKYGMKKITRMKLKNEMPSAYFYLRKNKMLDKYCSKRESYGGSKKLSEDIIIQRYNHLKQKLGIVPTVSESQKNGVNGSSLRRYFNMTYPEFVKFMDDEPIRSYEKLYNDLKQKLGRVPTVIELHNNGVYNDSLRRFFNMTLAQFRNHMESLNKIKITEKFESNPIMISKNKRTKKGIKVDYPTMNKQVFKSTEDKVGIRSKIISKIADNDTILLLESPELLALKEIVKQGKKPSKIIIPNHSDFKKVAEALQGFKTDFNIELINTSALKYLGNTKEVFDFIWLDYNGAFSFYTRDLDMIFQKEIRNLKLILTYNVFDPGKEDDSYYYTRVINYVLNKVSIINRVKLFDDVSYKYKKNMYNIGFDISKAKIET